jgi:hypothetical protein
LNIQQKTSQFYGDKAQAYLNGDIIFPIPTGSHFIMCFISKADKTITIADGYRGRKHADLFGRVTDWYAREHCTRLVDPPDFATDGWRLLSDDTLPRTRPMQTDSSSCAVLVAFTVDHFLRYGSWPDSSQTFHQGNVLQLREFMLWTLMSATTLPGNPAIDYQEFTHGPHNDAAWDALVIDNAHREVATANIMARQQQLSCFVDGEMSRQDQHIAMALSLRESTPEPSLVSRFEELIHVTPDGTKICELESFDTDVMPEGVTTLPKYSRLAIPITTESFARLRPEVWLNDEVND